MFFGTEGGRWDRKVETSHNKNIFLGPILNVHTKFQSHTSIWREDIRDIAFSQKAK